MSWEKVNRWTYRARGKTADGGTVYVQKGYSPGHNEELWSIIEHMPDGNRHGHGMHVRLNLAKMNAQRLLVKNNPVSDGLENARQAARQYGADIAADGAIISPTGKMLSMSVIKKGKRYSYEGAGHVMGSSPATVAGTGQFLEKFYLWRKQNPLKASIADKLKKAKALRAGFRYTAGGRPGQKSKVKASAAPPVDDVQVIIGIVDAIEYTVLDEKGRRIKGQSFRHEFTGKSCPLLSTGADGKQLYFVGGNYRFKTDGINDL